MRGAQIKALYYNEENIKMETMEDIFIIFFISSIIKD